MDINNINCGEIDSPCERPQKSLEEALSIAIKYANKINKNSVEINKKLFGIEPNEGVGTPDADSVLRAVEQLAYQLECISNNISEINKRISPAERKLK